jgi:hypothetical protein
MSEQREPLEPEQITRLVAMIDEAAGERGIAEPQEDDGTVSGLSVRAVEALLAYYRQESSGGVNTMAGTTSIFHALNDVYPETLVWLATRLVRSLGDVEADLTRALGPDDDPDIPGVQEFYEAVREIRDRLRYVQRLEGGES